MLDPLFRLALALALGLCVSFANAEGISVVKAEARAVDEGYEIVADFKIVLPPSVSEALKRGVVLNFITELAITRSRWYWLDTDVMSHEQSTKLSYNALTRQYRISRGTLFQGFSSLENALRVLGHQSAPPVPAGALSGSDGYVAQLIQGQIRHTAFAQMRLDVSQLPKPLQVSALTNPDWNLDSERHSWPILFEVPVPEEAGRP
jgi:hypothetical protein